MNSEPSAILVFRIGGIGDAITATPVLRALRAYYPKAHMTLQAEETPAKLLEHSGWVDEFLCDDAIYRCQNPLRLIRPQMMKRMYSLRKHLKQREYDLFIELHRLIRWSLVLKPWLFSNLSGANRSIGLNTDGRGFFLDEGVPDDPTRIRSQVECFSDVLEALDVPMESTRPEVPLTDHQRRRGRTILGSLGISNDRVVGLFLGANPKFPQKYWSVERFARFAEELNNTGDYGVVGFAGPEEVERVRRFEALTGDLDRVETLTENFPIRDVAGFISQLSYLVSVDTGPMHLGVAVQTPTLGIFGPSEWHWYGTYPEGFDFIRVGPPGSEERERKEPDVFQFSMEEVTVESVQAGFDELVKIAD